MKQALLRGDERKKGCKNKTCFVTGLPCMRGDPQGVGLRWAVRLSWNKAVVFLQESHLLCCQFSCFGV